MPEIQKEIFLSDGSRCRVAAPAKADAPAALCEAGIGHMLAGRGADAQLCAQQALVIDPDHADALHLMGLLCVRSGQYDHAVEWFGRAIRQNPKPEYLSNLGIALKQGGRLDEALQVFDKAIQLKPDDPQAWFRLANVLVALGRKSEALLAYQRVSGTRPISAGCCFMKRSGSRRPCLASIDATNGGLTTFRRCKPARAAWAV